MTHCFVSEKGLDLDTAIRLLENVESYANITQPPVKPKGGEVFLFLPETANEQENYKCDQYRWLNSGPKEIPRKNPLVKKQYFIGKLPGGKTQAFQKHCYVLVSDHRVPYPVLLHYIGDETVMVDHPHGNSKSSNSAYFAIAPSVRRDIADRSRCSMPTAIINSYKMLTPSPSSYTGCENGEASMVNPVLTPRNKSQVRNIRRKQKLSDIKQGLSMNDVRTLHSLGSDLLGFTRYIRTHPDLLCIVGLNDISNELENLMKLNNNTVVFSFQESYKIGRYVLTPFNFIHSAFSELPVIPCYFIISEVCDFFVYERFLQTIVDCIPVLEHCQTAIITNQDYNFTSSLSILFPNWLQIYDWEILFVAARSFLRRSNADTKDISLRIKQLKILLSSASIDDYRIELVKLRKEWPLAFYEYYMQVLQEPVEINLGRWVLEQYKLYVPEMGVLRGINTDLQLVVKHLQELKDASLDVILPSLYHLQLFTFVNVQKGFCGIGRYSLNSSSKFLSKNLDKLVIPSKLYEPSNIVKIFRVRGITMFSEDLDSSEDENMLLLQAQRIVDMDNISHSTSLKAFLVKSTSGSLHGVQLFPRECCSCSVNQRCVHIMAVMLALGMPLTSDKKGAIKLHKPQVGTNLVTEHSVEIAQHVNTPCEVGAETATDISTCGDDVYDNLTIVDTKEPVEIEMMNDHIAPQNCMDDSNDTSDQSMSVQALELEEIPCVSPPSVKPVEISCVSANAVSSDINPVYTSISAVFPHADNLLINTNSHLQNDSISAIQINSSDLECVLNGVHGSDVLMVVTDPNESDKKSILASYEVAQQTLMAYTQTQQNNNNEPHFNHVGIIGINEQGDAILHTSNVGQELDDRSVLLSPKNEVGTIDIPPSEELILRMSEEIHT